MTSEPPIVTGPILFLDDIEASGAQLSALFIATGRARPEPVKTVDGVHAAERLADYDHATVWRARFHLPADRQSVRVVPTALAALPRVVPRVPQLSMLLQDRPHAQLSVLERNGQRTSVRK